MKIILLSILLAIIISSILIFLNSSISSKFSYWEKNSSFECGFDQNSLTRIPFSMQFFLIAIIFLIFDIEISLISPLPLLINLLNLKIWILINLFFTFILLLGIFHEWNEGSLNWSF